MKHFEGISTMQPSRSVLVVFAAVLALLVTSAPVLAHHSFAAEFDANKPLKLTGTVTKLEWTNPHTWFFVEVKGEDGKITTWGFEMGSPNGLMRAGWSRNSMKVGDLVIVEASQAKDGSHNANAKTVTLVGTGKTLFAASSQAEGR